MKACRKILCIVLALIMTLALAVPAFAASDLDGSELDYGQWGSEPGLKLKGVVSSKFDWLKGEKLIIYDVAVGGSLVLDMNFPVQDRYYSLLVAGVTYAGREEETPNWDIPEEKLPLYEYHADTGVSQYVYNFTEDDMGQYHGFDKYIVIDIYWADTVDIHWGVTADGYEPLNSGGVYFAVRVVPAEEQTSAFSDVKPGDYFAGPVAWAVEKGVTNGTGANTFSPNDTCSQAQILTFLWRAKDKPSPAGAVSGAQYYANAAQWAAEQGLTDAFSADAPCTRAMVVTYLWRLAGSPKAGDADFSDVDASAEYAQAVAWAVEKGITNGSGNGTFSPNDTCTRGQIVTFLYRAFA